MMIYEPTGRAREYSPLALNIYTGCDHGCRYCYVPALRRKTRESFQEDVRPRSELVRHVERQAGQLNGEDQVLLCFTGDPYCHADLEYKVTRSILDILLEHQIPTAILTKGGSRCLRDLDLFKRFDGHTKVGATLTFTSKTDELRLEPLAAPAADRLTALKVLHENGIRTWVSFEPVIEPAQTLELLDRTLDYVDEYKVGKINNYLGLDGGINWADFVGRIVRNLRAAGKRFYIKRDLRERCPEVRLSEDERDQDRLLVEPFPEAHKLHEITSKLATLAITQAKERGEIIEAKDPLAYYYQLIKKSIEQSRDELPWEDIPEYYH